MSDSRFDVSWTCLFCGQVNVDNFEEIFMPFCDGCKREIFWEDILTDKQIDDLNQLKK
ncbi:hypothetical protein [Syntrophus aciditrophicus]|uniref:hypothetical protein n=1 Tax=Syntrophus aciditrophicus TaxID=316277 RepID=UPI0002F54400|nr:hypothetical protein [Syntrophus aciditrophicus]OPY18130.1 MAG: hypothetical protein A4E74_00777 [Syntrophus sp. PtaB.Bin075]